MFEPLDEDIPSDIEEGEISDCDYTPLERPAPVSQQVPNVIKVLPESSSDDDKNGDSDDEDHPVLKLKRQRIDTSSSSNTQNKYKIWCQSLQDETLAENLGSCDVDVRIEDRNVENYNYKLKFQDENGRKRKHDHGYEQEKRNDSNNRASQGQSQERIILALKHTEKSSEEDLAEDIANKLLEVESGLVLRTVQFAGKKEAINFYEKTKEIEKSGGMWLESQNRRRTPGGIFFFLVKNDRHLPQGVIKTIFEDPKRKQHDKQRKLMKKKKKKMERDQKNKELKQKLQGELSIISANVQNSKSSEGDSNPPPSPVSETEDLERMESD